MSAIFDDENALAAFASSLGRPRKDGGGFADKGGQQTEENERGMEGKEEEEQADLLDASAVLATMPSVDAVRQSMQRLSQELSTSCRYEDPFRSLVAARVHMLVCMHVAITESLAAAPASIEAAPPVHGRQDHELVAFGGGQHGDSRSGTGGWRGWEWGGGFECGWACACMINLSMVSNCLGGVSRRRLAMCGWVGAQTLKHTHRTRTHARKHTHTHTHLLTHTPPSS